MIRFALGVLLAGFAVASWSKEPAKHDADEKADSGFVRVTLPQGELQDKISLRPLKGKKTIALMRTPEDGPYAYGASLPAGEYYVDAMLAMDGTPYLPVIVKRGTLTDLGAIVLVSLGGYEFERLPVTHPDADSESRAALEHRRDWLGGAEPLRWRPTAPSKPLQAGSPPLNMGLVGDLLQAYSEKVNRPRLSHQLKEAPTNEEMYRLARMAVAPRNDESAADDAGNLFFAAPLGQLRVRHADGSWASIDTGVLDEITAVEANGAQLVAGTLRGDLLLSADRGASWKRSELLAPGEVAADIDRAGGRWLVLAAKIARPTAQTIDTWGPHPWTIPGKTVRVLAATRDDLSDLEAIGEFPLGEPLWAMRLQGQSDAVTGQVTPSAYWVSAVADLHRLDLKTWQWSVAKQPGHRFDSLRFSTDGSLMTVFRQQGAFSKVSLSRDEGASWVPYSRPPYTLYDVVLDTPDSGMATRLNAEAFTTVIEFYEYDPKLKDWRKSHETPKGCVRLLRDAAYRQRFCLTSGGSILDYRNGQWQVEFALE